MDFLHMTLGSAAENVALDEALLLQAEQGHSEEVLRIWQWSQPAVVLGSGCVLGDDVDVARTEADRVPIIRRSSGGGTVLLGQGCLCYTLILRQTDNPALAGIRTSYAYILSRMIAGLGIPGMTLSGISDLTLNGRKFSGNAQQRKRHFLLHHGTLLHDFDLDQVSRYLRLPERQPEYREHRPHEEFICNLPITRERLIEQLQSIWQAEQLFEQVPIERAALLVAEKYGRKDWTARR